MLSVEATRVYPAFSMSCRTVQADTGSSGALALAAMVARATISMLFNPSTSATADSASFPILLVKKRSTDFDAARLRCSLHSSPRQFPHSRRQTFARAIFINEDRRLGAVTSAVVTD